MDWSSIERNIKAHTESLVSDKMGRSGILQVAPKKRWDQNIIEEGPLPNPPNYVDENERGPLVSSILRDMTDLRNTVRLQSSKMDTFEANFARFDHDAIHLRQGQDSILDRLDSTEMVLHDRIPTGAISDQCNDLQVRVKRVESHVDGLEENAKLYQIQYATKDSFSKLLETTFDQIKALSTTVESTKEQSSHAVVLFDALTNALMTLSGPNNRNQLDLVTSFSRDVNKEQLARILTESLMHSIDSSIQAHLRPAMGLVNASVLDAVNDIRERQDEFTTSMVAKFNFLKSTMHEERESIQAQAASRETILMEQLEQQKAAAKLLLDGTFVEDFKQMKEQLQIISDENSTMKETLQQQTQLINGLVHGQTEVEKRQTGKVLELKVHTEHLQESLSKLELDLTQLRNQSTEARLTTNQAIDQLKETESGLLERVESAHRTITELYSDLTDKISVASDTSQLCSEIGAINGKIDVQASTLMQLEAALPLKADKKVVDDAISRLEKVDNRVLDLQTSSIDLSKAFASRTKQVDTELKDLGRRGDENMDYAHKLSRRIDLQESAFQTKVNTFNNELQHKISESNESVNRLTRRVDGLQRDTEATSSSLADTQSKVQLHSMELVDASCRISDVDNHLQNQVQALSSEEKQHFNDTSDSVMKLERQIALLEAELTSKLKIRHEQVDSQLVQQQDALSRLTDKLDYVETKCQANVEELGAELREKISGAIVVTSELNRRFDNYTVEAQSKIQAIALDIDTRCRGLNDHIERVAKQSEVAVEVLQTQCNQQHKETSVKIAATGESLSHLAQQQYDLCQLQEKQQLDYTSLANGFGKFKEQTDDKFTQVSNTFQTALTGQGKAHQASLSEMRYDLLQLISRVALVEQLIRYGNDMEDFAPGDEAAASTFSSEGRVGGKERLLDTTSTSSQIVSTGIDNNNEDSVVVSSPSGRVSLRRPDKSKEDPINAAAVATLADVQKKVALLQETVEAIQAEIATHKLDIGAKVDTSKVALQALRSQYEGEVDQFRSELDRFERKISRCDKSTNSMQTQIDILHDEVQSQSHSFDRELAKVQRSIQLPPPSPSIPHKHLSEVSAGTATNSSLLTRENLQKLGEGSDRKVRIATPDKDGATQQTSGTEPPHGRKHDGERGGSDGSGCADQEVVEDEIASEGSDVVFATSSPPPVTSTATGSTGSTGKAVTSTSTPTKTTLQLSSSPPGKEEPIPMTPDSPWDKDSEDEDDGDSRSAEGKEKEKDNSSSVDSEMADTVPALPSPTRTWKDPAQAAAEAAVSKIESFDHNRQHRTSSASSASISSAAMSTTIGTGSAPRNNHNDNNSNDNNNHGVTKHTTIRGPPVTAISPAKPLLSGSLLRTSRGGSHPHKLSSSSPNKSVSDNSQQYPNKS